MNDIQRGILDVISAAFVGVPDKLPANFDYGLAEDFAVKNNIVCILYYGLLRCGVPEEIPEMKKLFALVCRSTSISENQVYEIKRVFTEFEKKQIDYMPLKGTIMKEIYPKSEMRTMGDADVLIRIEQYQKICEILQDCGYEFKYESDHELVWKKRTLLLELHKNVMTSYNKDFYSYYADIWNKVRKNKTGGTRYSFSDEDFYIYAFVHLTKHYRISGIGIKHFIDIWVLRSEMKKMNYEYIDKELKKLGLYIFHNNIVDTLNVWFNNGEENEKTKMITDVVFSSGQYGTVQMTEVNRTLRDAKNIRAEGVKLNKIICSLFPPFESMAKRYSVLNKIPILLPIFWAIRIIKICIFKRKDLLSYTERMKLITDDNMREAKNALKLVGLEFDFKE